jgi:hypothetical protein
MDSNTRGSLLRLRDFDKPTPMPAGFVRCLPLRLDWRADTPKSIAIIETANARHAGGDFDNGPRRSLDGDKRARLLSGRLQRANRGRYQASFACRARSDQRPRESISTRQHGCREPSWLENT